MGGRLSLLYVLFFPLNEQNSVEHLPGREIFTVWKSLILRFQSPMKSYIEVISLPATPFLGTYIEIISLIFSHVLINFVILIQEPKDKKVMTQI